MKLLNTEAKKYTLGIYEKAINAKFDWDTKFRIAKDSGFDFIEISIDENDSRIARLDWNNDQIYQLRAIANKYGMYFNSMCLSANRKLPLGSLDKEVQKKGLQLINKAFVFAKKLGIRIIQLAGYDEYYNESNQETKHYFLENMKTVCNLAQYYSLSIAFESMDTFFMGSLTRILNVVNYLDSPFLGIYPDIGNLTQFAKENFESEIELAKNKIVAFHFKDTLPDKFKCVPFGSGSVDFVSALLAIFKINYFGPYMIEMWSENKKDETESENIQKLKDAKQFFETMYEKALLEYGKNR
ncbi:MAG: L-ribulose-5-phosphate 3-epimerase [Malacoplasma sp.]|nr:L-ribulose-5-phosphate 3-epimerase [Malacoplasma sp.]